MDSGSYRIYLQLEKVVRLRIGALGVFTFNPGIYVYTGSAMKNLEKRVKRHKLRKKTKRWHIDYLTSNRNFKVIKTEIFPSTEREECKKNLELLKMPGAEVPVLGFGSSDCRTCPAHLVYFSK